MRRNENRKLVRQCAQEAGIEFNGTDHDARAHVIEALQVNGATTQEIAVVTGQSTAAAQKMYSKKSRLVADEMYAHMSLLKNGYIDTSEYEAKDALRRTRVSLTDTRIAQLGSKMDRIEQSMSFFNCFFL